jgi:hypothetical protein
MTQRLQVINYQAKRKFNLIIEPKLNFESFKNSSVEVLTNLKTIS